ncbi:MAG: hypothetical protein QOG16_1216 [Actinomycetota bacterium]|jgi:signal transduction histidine kinase|nr:hypothetical protein [Actinomycetota bacterium]
MPGMGSWISHQVSEFLARVTSYPDEASALRGGIEHAGESLEAEVAAVSRRGTIVLSIGLSDRAEDEAVLLDAASSGSSTVDLRHLGPCHLMVADLEDGGGAQLVVARAGDETFSRDEQSLLDNMGRTLGLVLRMLRTLDNERAALRDLEERQLLLERLTRIQGSISHRAPLQEVLDSITEGVVELLGDELAVIRLIDPDDARQLILASAMGIGDQIRLKVHRIGIDEGVAGRSIKERRLCMTENYADASGAIPAFVEIDAVQAAMAVPLFVDGQIAGSLVTGTRKVGRVYGEHEREMLTQLGESASIALTDASTVESMREARRSKDAFLTMVSHELKTPLTVMMGALHTLFNRLDAVTPEMKRDLLDSALRRGEDLQRLIDMLLIGARADLVGARQKIVLPSFLAEALQSFESSRSVTTRTAPDVTFWADAVALHQIVKTLLENAAAHSPESTDIEIEAALVGESIAISVRNQGVLPDVDVETLFAPFQRGPDATSSGMGLGLYVARSLAESIEGRIEVSTSDESVGFTLVFPAEVVSDDRQTSPVS